MGESAEKMAKENGISREDQDAFALRSHTLAAKAWAEGRFADQVLHAYLPPSYQAACTRDNLVRDDTTAEKLAQLKPAFDRRYGTITAGSSSPFTDGASALLLMSAEKARSLGYEPLGFVRSYAFAAIDPAWQMLMGPSFATPVALDRAGLTLKDMDLIDMHEAFAAQVLSNVRAFASRDFARERLGRDQAIGEIDMDRFNVNGGSIAIGHPFAATGGRLVLQTLTELERRGQQFGLVTLCAAGGLGAAAVLERE
jgi:acetyl-CoA acyltransferase